MTANNPPRNDNGNYYSVDFALNYEPVTASASGTVRFAGEDAGDGYGKKVEIDHPGTGGYFTMYAHLNSINPGLSQGAPLTQGQSIGTSGQSGGNYAPHLHFQLQSGLAAAIPEPMSGVSGFANWGLCSNPLSGSGLLMSRPPWQPEYAYQPYGTPWGGASEGPTASSSDFSQYNHSVLARVNYSIGGYIQWRRSLGGSSWGDWQTITQLAPTGKIAISNHRNGTQDQVHVAAVYNGDMWYRKRVGTSWNGWQNLGRPPGVTSFDGAVAINNSDIRAIVGGVAGGNVYVKLWYAGSWGSWVSLGGANTLTGSLAIATRPNGMYHIVALRLDGHIFITCSLNYGAWTGWTDIGWIFGDALSVDNDAASPALGCGTNSNPGVVVLGFSGSVAYVWCWEAYCPQPYEQIGGAVGGPAAISNAVNPYSDPPNTRLVVVVTRSSNNALVRYRVY